MAEQPLKDGPIKSGRCAKCKKHRSCDIYVWHGQILCGDCRYEARHGFPPNREPIGGVEDRRQPRHVSDFEKKGSAPSTQGRFLPTQALSAKHAEILIDIERAA